MADITKCTGKNCAIKDLCYRYTAYDGYMQSYANFNEDKEIKSEKDCDVFIKGKKEVKVDDRKINK